MHKAALLSLASAIAVSTTLVSCATKSDTELKLDNSSQVVEQTSAPAQLYNKAANLDKAGKTKKAAKTYGKVADLYPISQYGSKARFRQAELLYAQGKLIESFESYQKFISDYRGTNLYQKALKQQEAVAHAAATGEIKNNFVGLKSNIPRQKTETMLTQVRDNAPFAKSAARAQFAIGQMWEEEKSLKKAIAAYEEVQVRFPSSKYAPQALYKVGSLLLKQAEKGNRNQGNLNTAKSNFNDIISLYPSSKEAKKARVEIKKINQSDISRSFANAEFYQKKKQNTAAIFYYKEVVRKSKPGSELHTLAKQRIATLSK